jgi:hypothetical protein
MSVPVDGLDGGLNTFYIGGGGETLFEAGSEEFVSDGGAFAGVGIGDPAAFAATLAGSPHALSADAIFDVALEQVAVHMSVCEDVMRRATGSSTPPVECWGCTIHPQFHEQRFHFYRD